MNGINWSRFLRRQSTSGRQVIQLTLQHAQVTRDDDDAKSPASRRFSDRRKIRKYTQSLIIAFLRAWKKRRQFHRRPRRDRTRGGGGRGGERARKYYNVCKKNNRLR